MPTAPTVTVSSSIPPRTKRDSPLAGTLYLVATPIGNLEDITLRALRVLKACDRIACEDTRHSRKLLAHFEISRPLVSFHAHNAHARTGELVAALQAGRDIALITDAGMPGVSDPGAELVAACRAENLPVSVIPGPSALTAALALAGCTDPRFVFEGFLPTTSRRRERLVALAREERPVVLFEAPHRLLRTLADLSVHLGAERPVAICRELTKIHEQVWRGGLSAAIAYFETTLPRGEFTLVLEGAPPQVPELPTREQLQASLEAMIASGLSRSEASRQLAAQTGLPRKEIYRLSLTLEADGGSK
ncbi:16S rRNA (cytidine(1402)-2'-O)-methyltransferase [Gloeobacter violaceus]|uniref:Ribosomal RNA small subunit methyltransferase I n=1 Tax=Gloeobacter violaceus (strain ATCC 29082 / PCC 7421) TaxID=251221 RepID=Q7NCF8_GLOVI|nr:tetrapyrrole methylase family protein [Gloeobacter violaceus PCC 7421]